MRLLERWPRRAVVCSIARHHIAFGAAAFFCAEALRADYFKFPTGIFGGHFGGYLFDAFAFFQIANKKVIRSGYFCCDCFCHVCNSLRGALLGFQVTNGLLGVCDGLGAAGARVAGMYDGRRVMVEAVRGSGKGAVVVLLAVPAYDPLNVVKCVHVR
ncbi:hypothetical protein [Pseudomonas phage vB_PaeS_SCH_Ab26]|uniref:Uncharacterized protein n=1 Tax=Pseudomonas phage vB_PaeS_SCH_Ab26 TaxID=1476390 RepID=A0A060RFN5_9CAUD|nr:hypothetical protein HL17_gp37 [Pseudomonas phage vB_PaeS_SCH_Ab26]CDN96798.1 hypothetical protein [Pseudomonas phage vB_PaeS_SCH_Ab26]